MSPKQNDRTVKKTHDDNVTWNLAFFFFVSFSVCTKPEKCSQMLCVLKMSAISLRVSAFRDVFYNHSFRDSSVGPLNVDSACSQKER